MLVKLTIILFLVIFYILSECIWTIRVFISFFDLQYTIFIDVFHRNMHLFSVCKKYEKVVNILSLTLVVIIGVNGKMFKLSSYKRCLRNDTPRLVKFVLSTNWFHSGYYTRYTLRCPSLFPFTPHRPQSVSLSAVR